MTQIKDRQELTTTILSQLANLLGYVPNHTRLELSQMPLSQLEDISQALDYFEKEEKELGVNREAIKN